MVERTERMNEGTPVIFDDNAELKPCPFCGNKNPTLIGHDGWFVECSCGAAGAECDSKHKNAAIRAWNRRVMDKQNDKSVSDKDSRIATQVVMWTLLIIILGTLLGAWVKFYWIDWVFAG